jgi:hypothetical protein
MRFQRSYSTISSAPPAGGELAAGALLERKGERRPAPPPPPRHHRRTAPPPLQYLAGGSQAGLFTLPGAEWVVKCPRLSLLAVLALYLRLPLRRVRAEVEASAGGLVLPYTVLRATAFRGVRLRGSWDIARPVPGSLRLYRPRRAILTYRLDPADILEEQLERGTPAQVAAGLEAQLGLLERLADRGFYLLDFVMKNFAWHEGRLVIADVDLILPGRWARNPHFWPAAHFFRRGLLKDYARVIRNALARASGPDAAATTGSNAAREALLRLRRDFPRRIHALARRAALADRRPDRGGERRPVQFPVEISRQVLTLLGR